MKEEEEGGKSCHPSPCVTAAGEISMDFSGSSFLFFNHIGKKLTLVPSEENERRGICET